MKNKELKNLANKIAKLENTIQTTENEKVKEQAMEEMYRLIKGIKSLDDIIALEEMVENLLKKN